MIQRMALSVSTSAILFLAGLLLLGGCATTAVGKAVQSAEGAKIAVESAADEVIRIHERKQLSDADYLKARASYENWAKAERTLTDALVAWNKNKDAAGDARVQAALAAVGPAIESAADQLCAFKAKSATLTTICGQIGR